MTTPLAVSIKRAIPGAAIDYLVFEGTDGVLTHNPLIRRIITVPRRGSNAGMLLTLFRHYDISLAAYPSDRTVIAAAIAGKYSIGLTYDSNKGWWKKALLSSYSICDDRLHVVTNVLSLLGPMGIPAVPLVAAGYDESDLAYARAAMPTGKNVILHPYSRNRCKYWPAAKWTELAGLIWEETGCRAIFTRTAGSEDGEYLEQILATAPSGVTAFKEPCTLSRLAAIIRESTAYIGIDTVVTHIAAELEVPTIAIFGPTLPRYWAPWPNGCNVQSPFNVNKSGVQRSGYVTVVQKDWECVPCNMESCAISTRGKMECLEAITPQEVLKEAIDAISRSGVSAGDISAPEG